MPYDVIWECAHSDNRCGKEFHQSLIITARRDKLLRRITFGNICRNLNDWTKEEFERMKRVYFANGGTITYCQPVN